MHATSAPAGTDADVVDAFPPQAWMSSETGGAEVQTGRNRPNAGDPPAGAGEHSLLPTASHPEN